MIKPELNPFSAAKQAMDSNIMSLEIALIYLDYVLAKDDYHDEIMDIINTALLDQKEKPFRFISDRNDE